MNRPKYNKEDVELFFLSNKISTLQDLKEVLGTNIDMTVFRILKSLSYRSSYSHNGRFYTLDSIIQFDKNGLWCHRSIYFSQHGNLLSTLEYLISESESGYYAQDLEKLLNVGVKESLLRLTQKGKIAREKISGVYLYCSSDSSIRKKQLLSRQVHGVTREDYTDEVKAAIVIFFSMLDEQQRRLFAGLEALKLGHGGDLRIADLLGLHPQTVAKGRRKLLDHDVLLDRTRKGGAGRKQVEKKHRR
ncbi:MAG: hypothetical protein ACE5I5_18345 [Candidatus Heimdallarchaeota archaeon]